MFARPSGSRGSLYNSCSISPMKSFLCQANKAESQGIYDKVWAATVNGDEHSIAKIRAGDVVAAARHPRRGRNFEREAGGAFLPAQWREAFYKLEGDPLTVSFGAVLGGAQELVAEFQDAAGAARQASVLGDDQAAVNEGGINGLRVEELELVIGGSRQHKKAVIFGYEQRRIPQWSIDQCRTVPPSGGKVFGFIETHRAGLCSLGQQKYGPQARTLGGRRNETALPIRGREPAIGRRATSIGREWCSEHDRF